MCTRKRKSHASEVMRNSLYISTFSYLLTYMTAHDSQSIGQVVLHCQSVKGYHYCGVCGNAVD